VLEIGVKGGDTPPQEIPMETNPTNTPAIGGDVWKAKVADTTIQGFKVGMKLTGVNNDELYGMVFVNPLTKNRCVALVYAKDGTSIFQDPRNYGGCRTTMFDAWWGTSDGYILRYPSLSNRCYKTVFVPSNGGFQEILPDVPCPN
jgi:hypothetical protein